MSIKFIQDAVMIEKRDDTEEKDFVRVLYMPKDIQEKPYKKALMEASVNILQLSTENCLNTKSGTHITDLDLNEGHQLMVREMADTLQYLVNSTSWGQKKWMPYDQNELLRRLELIEMIVKSKRYTEE